MEEPVGALLPNELSASATEPKKHAACDECRKRKLKCSGEPSGCSRCIKQSIICNYSVQKPMGRPPKKRARAADDAGEFSIHRNNIWPSPEDTPPDSCPMGTDLAVATDAQHLCPQFFVHHGGPSPPAQLDLLARDEDHNHTWRPERLRNPNIPVPVSSSPWPDFTAVSEATAMPVPPPINFLNAHSLPLTPPITNLSDPTIPQCTCLSYLYLCLSHISSIASFPVSSHTLCSLYIAARTAQDVIRCEACPKNFATGVQNVMFTGTLLTIVADAWLRVFNSDPVELGIQSAPPEFTSKVMQCANPAEGWKIWLRQIVRRAVVGGHLPAEAETRCTGHRDLLSLIKEVENRQRRWHAPGQHPCTGYNPMSSTAVSDSPNGEDNPRDEKELLCLRVVGSARAVLSKFNFEPHDFPEGVIPDDLKLKSP
ncbi:uncharacterized protein N7482_007557 [Penicillium canariense]|uniref:Zn(2)-C6 fungal-type domain-containing protein n=1 Tax=Penicillium canariense TaxID=189055 RepID=A0A9W9HX42_9EURO|nr:uncharacterized protein N7482_007557 [Penicillium canariense]KAJ5160553.1 hypothetical protein N7482_007557 [Penicillium canariense]